jgi:hypothetical protein
VLLLVIAKLELLLEVAAEAPPIPTAPGGPLTLTIFDPQPMAKAAHTTSKMLRDEFMGCPLRSMLGT